MAAAPASAHTKRHHHYRHHVWVHHGHGYGSYAYARRHRGPIYSGSTENERRCSLSPGSQAYEPCLNKP